MSLSVPSTYMSLSPSFHSSKHVCPLLHNDYTIQTKAKTGKSKPKAFVSQIHFVPSSAK